MVIQGFCALHRNIFEREQSPEKGDTAYGQCSNAPWWKWTLKWRHKSDVSPTKCYGHLSAYGPRCVGVNEEKLLKDSFDIPHWNDQRTGHVWKTKKNHLKDVAYWVASSWKTLEQVDNLITILWDFKSFIYFSFSVNNF